MTVGILGTEVNFGTAVLGVALAAGLVLIVWPLAVRCRRHLRLVRRAKRVQTARLIFVGDVMRAMSEHEGYLRAHTSQQEIEFISSSISVSSSTQQ